MSGGRAAVVTAPRTVEIRDLPDREPGRGEVAVAVHGCGVCGSNAPVWEGRPWFEYPLAPGAPGHEGWGTVRAVGDGVTGVRVGDPVALLAPTAFADRAVVDEHEVVPLPAALAGVAFPGEALGCGFNVAARSHFGRDDRVAVIGLGFIGAMATALAAAAGAHVIAIARTTAALDLARALGAADVVLMDDHERILGEVREMTDGAWCHTVVEAVGAQWPLDLAGQLTGFGGRLVVAGYHQDGPRTVDLQLWNWRGIDVINAHERDPAVIRRGVLTAAAAVVDGSFDPSPLYSHVVPLEEIGDALDALVDRPAGLVKALVRT